MVDLYTSIATNLFIFGFFGWLISLRTNNVTHVDSMWSFFFVIAYITVLVITECLTSRNIAVLMVVLFWATRLTTHLSIRNFGHSEDIRYQNIRKNNAPYFKFKSLYIIFIFQAALALIISMPLVSIGADSSPYDNYDKLGLMIMVVGISIEVIADMQLKQFVRNNPKKVLNAGLWRYSRHPNYFGECLVWWGIYIISMNSGSFFLLISHILMTLLLLKISGVALMENTITKRRPEYVDYIKKTSSFIPWPPKK